MDSNKNALIGGETTPALLKTKKIGENLEIKEFNAIMFLLKKNTSFKEVIDIHNPEIIGDYGTYVFNLDTATITDKGILITNQTLSNIGTVRLVDPVFAKSKYALYLTVTHINDVNLGMGEDSDNIEVSELIIELEADTNVRIPFNRLDINYIVGFKGLVVITHDIPEIL